MAQERLVPLLVWMTSLPFKFHLYLSSNDGQAGQKTTDSQNISQDLVRAITPAQEAGHL